MVERSHVMRRVAIILGHPRGADSLCGALAEAYAAGAREAGWAVESIDLSRLAFETDLRRADPRDQPLEPGLAAARATIEAADHLVFVYPTWWGVHPARLKGFLDRVLAPGWAFRRIDGGIGFEGLLKGRSAELITTMDTPNFVYRYIYGAPGHRAMARATLGFCGLDVVRITRFGPVEESEAAQRAQWINRARRLGARLAESPWSGGQRAWRRFQPWLRALRLQFYPLTVIAYGVGALAAIDRDDAFAAAAFWLGLVVVALLESATVFLNEVFDVETDRRNAFWGPFTGGSRVLVEGGLRSAALARAGWIALGAGLTLGALLLVAAPAPWSAALVLAVSAALAIGYTAPPAKLSYRGLGEIDVALTHSLGVVLFGYVLQGGALLSAAPYLLSAPLGLAIFPAITLSGIPDREADAAAGKRTLAVRFGVRGALNLAAAGVVVAATAAVALRHAAEVEALAGLDMVAPLHAGLLLAMLRVEARRGPKARRIDLLMAISLLYALWFGVIPLVNLIA